MTIGIIGAMSLEIDNLVARMHNVVTETVGAMTYNVGTVGHVRVIAAVCGIGKVHAAINAQTMIQHYSPDCIINTGVAGGLSADLSVGDIVLANAVVQHDFDTTAFGDNAGVIPGFDTAYFECSAEINKKLISLHSGLRTGIIATGDQFIADTARLLAIVRDFNAVAVEMEGGSIGQVCTINGVPFTIIRSISDKADEDAEDTFEQNAIAAAEKSIDLVMRFLVNSGVRR
jgi:adenosylhomocysteine nucleosidase